MKKETKQATGEKANAIPTEKETNTGLQIVKPEDQQEAEDTEFKVIELKPALNLDETVQVIMNLGKKIRQAQNLKTQGSQLEEFEIKNEGEYQSHSLNISDSNRRSFETKDAQLIKDVVNFIKKRIYETVTDLEANIILPN